MGIALDEYITRLLEAQNVLDVFPVVVDNPKTHADSLTKSTLKSRFGHSVSDPLLQQSYRRTVVKQSYRWEEAGDIYSINESKSNARWGTKSSSDPPPVSRTPSGLEHTELAALRVHKNLCFQSDQKDAHNESCLASRPVGTKMSNSQLPDFGLSNIRDLSSGARRDKWANAEVERGALADRWSITKSSSDSSLLCPKRSETIYWTEARLPLH
jgi:hypothetical protein